LIHHRLFGHQAFDVAGDLAFDRPLRPTALGHQTDCRQTETAKPTGASDYGSSLSHCWGGIRSDGHKALFSFFYFLKRQKTQSSFSLSLSLSLFF
jgi:hypothetical protein